MNTYDAIVVGLGGMGSAAAYHLARRGARVLGLERFALSHDKGSSHGVTRIIRLAYWEHPDYVPLLQRAFVLWRELETRANERLLVVTGAVDVAPAGYPTFEGSLRSCLEHDLPHEVLTGAELARRFPGYRYPEEVMAVYQPDGGFLLPERCIVAHASLALAHGAEIHAHERVLDWEPTRDGVRVRTDRGEYEAAKLVLAAGAWMGKLAPVLERLAVPERQVIAWFQPRRPELFEPQRFPVFNSALPEGVFYGFPSYGIPGFKLGRYHHLGETVDPETVDREPNARDEAILLEHVRRYFPEAEGPVMAMKVCLFTNTPDGHFVVDLHPEHSQVVLASPCSGHGFKFASVMGELLADLALQGRTTPAADFLRLERFASAH